MYTGVFSDFDPSYINLHLQTDALAMKLLDVWYGENLAVCVLLLPKL
jgi:hypothetical protein